MRYGEVTKARFLERPNRFIALVEREAGAGTVGQGADRNEDRDAGRSAGRNEAREVARDAGQRSGWIVERVHVKNTGRCRELLVPGAVVYLERGTAPGRKTAYDLTAVEKETERGTLLVNMDAQAPNAVFGEFAAAGRFCTAVGRGAPGEDALTGQGEPVSDVRAIRREAVWGACRLDFLLDTAHGPHLVEVKGVTLEEGGAARFPDAPTERGVKHLRELTAAVERGIAATVFFVIQMEGMRSFAPNDETHPAFGAALRKAAARGVDVQAWECAVTPASLDIVRPVPVLL